MLNSISEDEVDFECPAIAPQTMAGVRSTTLGGHGLELIAQRIVIASFQTALLALAFACLDEVF
jgi:hypothetical protein